MVINVGLLKSSDLEGLYNDVSSVVSAAMDIPVKAIVETSLLTKEQKISASVIAALAGAAYVKTSTGFNGGGATVEDVELMYQAVAFKKGAVKVKASGGIRSFEYDQFQLPLSSTSRLLSVAISMLRAGADRLGTSSGVSIVTGAGTAAGAY